MSKVLIPRNTPTSRTETFTTAVDRPSSNVWPALGLFFLAPLVAEFLLGNLPITALPLLVVLAPLYGGGALLIRELARRTQHGWPTIVVLALAYGVLEEGIITMSLFNPNYAGQRLLDTGFIPILGIGGPWTLYVLTLHAVWSVSVPIALVELLAGSRGYTPWLGNLGLAVVGLVFLGGCAAVTAFSIASSQFVAPATQLVVTGVVVISLMTIALSLPRFQAAPGAGHAPNAWLVGLGALFAASAFKAVPWRQVPAWPYAALMLVLAAVSIVAVWSWSHRAGWGDAHRLALAGGALLTYAWSAFLEQPVLPASLEVKLVGNTLFALGAVALLIVAARTVVANEQELRSRERVPARVTSGDTRLRHGR